MITNLRFVGKIYKNCGPTGAQQTALAADQAFGKQALEVYGENMKNMQEAFSQVFGQVNNIVEAGIGQQGWTPAEAAARSGEVINQTAANAKMLNAAIADKAAASSGGGAGLTTGATQAVEAGAEAQVLNKESSELQQNVAENYATGRENYLKALGVEAELPGLETEAAAKNAQPVSAAYGQTSQQANENAAASSSWMGLVGGIADAAVGGLTGGIGGKKSGGGGGGGADEGSY